MSELSPEERLEKAVSGVADMLREYADLYETGKMQADNPETALRTIALMLEAVAEADKDRR